MKYKNRTLITKETEISREFKTVFQNLLNRTTDEPQITTEYISVEPEDKEPSLEEIVVAIKLLKNYKGAGNDVISQNYQSMEEIT